MNRKLRSAGVPIEDAIAQQLERRRPVAVLEIGCGWGPVLIELAWRFREEPVRFAGINLEAEPPVERAEDLTVVAEALDIVPAGGGLVPRAPGGALLRRDDAARPRREPRRDLLGGDHPLHGAQGPRDREVARALRPGGRALLQIGESGWEYPAGTASDPVLLTRRPARMVVHRDLDLVPLQEHLAVAAGERFTIRVPTGRRCVVDMTKHAPGRLDLRLELDEERTIPMRAFPHPRKGRAGGIRTAYRIAEG